MNSEKQDEPLKPGEAMETIRKVVEKLGPTISEAAQSMETLGQKLKGDKPRGSHWGSKNHNQKRDKKKAKMAKKSRRINRKKKKK